MDPNINNNENDMPLTDNETKNKLYNEVIDAINKGNTSDQDRWEFEEIIGHRTDPKTGKIQLKMKWKGYDIPTWEPLVIIWQDEPQEVRMYAEMMGLTGNPKWRFIKRNPKNQQSYALFTTRAYATKKKKNLTPKYKFGQKVPRSINECYLLDKENNNNEWAQAIDKEVKLLRDEYKCFEILPKGRNAPIGYKYIKLLWTFDVKFDGRKRARCVAGGHMTDPLDTEATYAPVVTLDSVRLAFIAAELQELTIIAADIGSAFIQAYTKETVYTIAGPEFGPYEGQVLLIDRALYGLQSSANAWHEKFADNLRSMGFTPSMTDSDLWIKCLDEHYEYICVYVDDIIVFSKKPEIIIEQLKNKFNYELKGVGEPEYYNGADVTRNTISGSWEFSAKTYLKNVCEKIEKLLDIKLKNYGSPMEVGDHPEIDESDLLNNEDITIYQMLIGCAQWAVTIGRFDIQYATNTLARFAQLPREGHLKRVLRMFGYLKHHYKHRIKFDLGDPNYYGTKFLDHDWDNNYPEAEEDIPTNTPKAVTRPIYITCYVDASHACDLLTRRSTTGILICINKTPVKWYSKKQNTVESSTYGAELVAARIAVEMIIEFRYKARMMGMEVVGPSVLFVDNDAVVKNTTLPSSTLKKKHNAIAYHKVREAVAAGIIKVAHIKSENNMADILTKPLSPQRYYNALRWMLFRREHSTNQGELQLEVDSHEIPE